VIRGIFFDCFGVLYVTVTEAYFVRFPELHEELYDLNKQADHGFIDRATYIGAVAKLTGVSESETSRAFAGEHTINQPLIDYIKTELKPHYKIGLVSNIGRDWIQDFFDEHELHGLFDTVVLSSTEGITKPNPLIFDRAAERMGIYPDEAVFVDDRLENCEGAKASGMTGVVFENNEDFKTDLTQLLHTNTGGANNEN
jgi:HAD superfamily hydrolase (TIGR01509 family)